MKISIITPSFNQGQFIERTLQSVTLQRDSLPKDASLEHIIYDGGSTDNTLEVLLALPKNPNIIWVSEPDKGQTHAINKGLKHSTGEIIGWLNSDDIYYPNTLAKILKVFSDNPEIDVVYGMANHIDINDNIINSYPTTKFSLENLTENCFICQPALFFRSRVLEKTGLLDESLHYCMDYDFWLRMALCGVKFAYLEEILAGSRLYAENKTLSAKVAVHSEINDMLKRHLNTVPMSAIINYAYAVVNEELNKKDEPYKFAYKLFNVAMVGAKKWNGSRFKFFQKACKHWFKALMQGRLKMWRKV